MTKRQRLILLAVAVGSLLVGWLAGGSGNVAEAQTRDPLTDFFEGAAADLLQGYEWRMFGGNVAGTGGSGGSGGSDTLPGSTGIVGRGVYGETYLYNSKTGKVYRVFSQCGGDEGANGCLIAMPVFSADRLDDFLPNPATGDLPGNER